MSAENKQYGQTYAIKFVPPPKRLTDEQWWDEYSRRHEEAKKVRAENGWYSPGLTEYYR